jgi:hypothetical protein
VDSGILFRQTSDKKKMVRFFLFSGMQAKYGYLYRREIPIFWNKFACPDFMEGCWNVPGWRRF